jgi:putative ABC transport system permease protein
MLPIGLGLLALVGLVLVIACANLASMLLARAAARQREIGIRLAVGAGRGRLVRQLLSESTLLGLLGAIAGAMITWGLARALAAAPQALPIAVNVAIELDLRVWGFLLAVSLAAGMAAGLAPALRVTRVDLVADLKGSQAIRAIGTRWALRDLLVAGQMALTTLLIVAAGLLVRSLLSATGADTGFRHHGLAIVSTDPEMARYDEAGARQLLDRARARIATLPGVTGVATATRVPFSLNFTESQFLIAGHERAEGRGWTVLNAGVSPEYFQVLGVPIVQGRGFSTADGATSAKVAVVSEAMARRFWPEEGAIGRQLRLSNRPAETIEVVGVAGDHLVRTVGEEPQPYVYFPLEQRWNSAQILVARTDGDPRGLVSHMERELLALEPNLVLIDNQTMDDQMATMLLPARAGALVALAGGLTALGLAALGLYGVMAYSVAGRTREIGIRMAVGASRGAVVALVLRKGLSIAAAGLAAGGLLATLAAQGAAGMLYGITAADPVAWVAAVGLLGAVSVLANLLPVRRALAIDPLLALRAD